MTEQLYVIRRESAEPSDPGDVYVTGPEFGSPMETGIYSSTRRVADASLYTAEEARYLAARKWRSRKPRVVPEQDAEDLVR